MVGLYKRYGVFTVRYGLNLYIKISLIFVFKSVSLANIILPELHTHHLHFAHTRRINWRSLGTFQKQSSFGNMEALDSKVLSLSIATRYGLDGPGIESRWGDEIFRTRPDRPWGPPSLPIQCVPSLSRG